MDVEQMELLERLARLRELGAISRREFQREKQAIFRALPRALPVPLRALPAPGAAGSGAPSAGPAASPAAVRPRVVHHEPEASFWERAARATGWVLWALFSIGGLDALLDQDPLQSLSLLLAGLFVSPPLHRLLATRMSLPTRLVILAVGVIAALGIGSAPSAPAVEPASAVAPETAAACGQVVSRVVEERGERARLGIARPWRKVWDDLRWARIAGHSAFEEWRASRS